MENVFPDLNVQIQRLEKVLTISFKFVLFFDRRREPEDPGTPGTGVVSGSYRELGRRSPAMIPAIKSFRGCHWEAPTNQVAGEFDVGED